MSSPTYIRKQDEDPEARLFRLINRSEANLRTVFQQIIRQVKGRLSLDELSDLIEAGNIQGALELSAQAGARFAAQVNGVYVIAGGSTATVLSDALEVIIDFDQVNVRAVSQMQATRLRLIREFNNQQRLAVQEALISGIQAGVNPRQQARAFRDSLGLTQSQVKAVTNFRRLLTENSREALSRKLRDRRFDPSILRAIETNETLTRVKINQMVDRYRDRFIRHRAEVIARTEALRAVHEGTEEMYRQAIDSDAVRADQLVRTWHTAMDVRVRDSHTAMNGQRQPFGEPFVSGFGNRLRHPGDINAPSSETVQCRCALSTRIATLSAG